MKRQVTVLITTATGLGYPGYVKALKSVKERKIRVIGTASEKLAIGFLFVDKSYVTPHAKKKNFIKAMLGVCKKEKVDVVIPTAPWELTKFAKNIDFFEKNGIKLCISSAESIKITLDKRLLFEKCKQVGVPVPKYYLVRNLREFKKAVSLLGYPKKEVCFKPAMSAGSRGFRILSKKADYFDLLLRQEGGSIYKTLGSTIAILKLKKSFPNLLVMEFLPKGEYSVDGLANKGKALILIPRIREKIAMGVSIKGKCVPHKRIIKLSEKITKLLKLHGVFGLQFRLDRKGVPKIIEINARPHGSLIFSIAAGPNLLYLAVKLLLGEEIQKPEIVWHTRTMRYFSEVNINPQGGLYEL